MAAGPGGPIVGRVRLKVAPDTKGFRKKVEKGLAGLRDIDIDVSPDMKGFRKKVNSATRGLKTNIGTDLDSRRLKYAAQAAAAGASGAEVKFISDLEERGLIRRARRAAEKASGQKIRYQSVLTTRFTNPNFAHKNNLPGLKKDMEFLRDAVKHITVDRLYRSVSGSERATRALDRALGGVSRTARGVGSGFGKGMQGTLKGIRAAVRSTTVATKDMGNALRSAPSDLMGQSKLVKGLGTIRRKVIEAKSAYDELSKTGGRPVLERADKAADGIRSEIADLKKLKTARQAFNRRGKRYNADLHRQYQKLTDEADKLRSSDRLGSGDRLKRVVKQLHEVRSALGESGKNAHRLMQRTEEASKAFADLNRHTRAMDRYRRIPLVDSKGFKHVVREVDRTAAGFRRMGQAVSRANAKVRETVGVRRIYTGLSKSVDRVTHSVKRMGSAISKQGISGPVGKLSATTQKIRDSYNRFLGGKSVGLRLGKGLGDAARSADAVSDGVGGITRGLKSAGGSARKLQNPFSRLKKMWGKFHQPENRIFGLTEMGWMALAITTLIAPLSGLIGGVLGALPSLGLAAAAALGATVLGWEGIKEAAQAAAPAVDAAKEVLSGTFQDRLTPQFEKLGQGLTKITPDLDKVAHGLSDFSEGFVGALTSDQGIDHIQKGLGNTAKLFSDLAPFASDFTEGLLVMASAGSETFDHLSDGLNSFGSNFKQSMTEMAADNTLQDAITSTYDVIGSIGTNLGKVMRAGMEEMPDMADAFTRGLDGLGDGLVAIMPLLSDLSQTAFDIFGSIGRGLEQAAPALEEFFGNIGPGIKDAFTGIRDFAGDALAPLGEFLQAVSPGAGAILSEIGQSIRELGSAFSSTDFGDEASKFGQFLSDLMEGAADAAPRFREDMAEIWNVLKWIDPHTTGPGEVLKMKGEEVREGIQVYGNALSRIHSVGLSDFNDAFALAQRDILSRASVMGDTVQEAAQSLKAAAERAMEATEIDLTPQIKALDAATTSAEINEVRAQIMELLGKPLTDEHANLIAIDVEPELNVDPSAAASAGEKVGSAMEPAGEAAKQSLTEVFEGMGEDLGATVDSEIQGALEQVDGAVAEAATGIGESLGTALGEVEIPTDGLTSSLMEAFEGLGTEISTRVQEIGAEAGTELSAMFDGVTISTDSVASSLSSGLSSSISSAVDEAASAAQSSATGIVDSLVSGLEGITSAAADALSGLPGEFEAKGSEAGTSLASGISSSEGDVTAAGGALKTAAENSVSGINLHSSGAAAGQTFAAGLRSQIGAVSTAASELAAAARNHFPNSPAKEGPFSGVGWVDRSGIAVGAEFAKGMLSQRGAVEKAASDVTGAAQAVFNDFRVDPSGYMEAFHRDAILQPVLESNAQKIASHREREAEAAERLSERIAGINESDADEAKKAERISDAREKAAERSAESREKMLESLEAPEYRDIDRSFQGYYVDGMRSALTQGLTGIAEEVDLAGQTRDMALAAVREGRSVFGSHPIFDQVEANVTADHFARVLQKVIEDSGIAEIPVDFAVSNLDQLKSDLGMGDGVISRALDQAMTVDPAATDARWARQNPVEIHYHVEDMQEAIRLEQERERKEMMRHR